MGDAPWKRTERRIAAKFGMRRNPLSGSRSGHNTRSDAIPDDEYAGDLMLPRERLYLEMKHSGSGKSVAAVLSLFDDTDRKARAEGRLPLLIHHWHGRRFAGTKEPFDVVTMKLGQLLTLLTIARDTRNIEEILNAIMAQ